MLLARDNPFSTDRIQSQRYRFSKNDWENLLEKLARLRGRGALVGPKGSGKTTLLEDLMAHLARCGRRSTLIRLSAECPRLPAVFNPDFFARLGHADSLLLDGAEQLSWLAWLRFRHATRHVGTVVITTHRTGRFPLLHRCTTTPDLLRELTVALGVSLTANEAFLLHQRHQGNLREALRELYDRFAEKHTPVLSKDHPLV